MWGDGMDKIEQKMAEYLDLYGIDGINLVIKRHELASRKRQLFTIRFVEEDPEKELEVTKEMEKLTAEIEAIDNELETLGINSKNRPQMIKNIKKYCPQGWFSGFAKEF